MAQCLYLHTKLKPMKNLLLIAAVTTLLFSFQLQTDKNLSRVNQERGFYIFTDATPVNEYEVLGEVKNGMSIAGSSQYNDVKAKLISKCRKDFPTGDGIIFSFTTGAADHATVIKFK